MPVLVAPTRSSIKSDDDLIAASTAIHTGTSSAERAELESQLRRLTTSPFASKGALQVHAVISAKPLDARFPFQLRGLQITAERASWGEVALSAFPSSRSLTVGESAELAAMYSKSGRPLSKPLRKISKL